MKYILFMLTMMILTTGCAPLAQMAKGMGEGLQTASRSPRQPISQSETRFIQCDTQVNHFTNSAYTSCY